MAIPIMDYTEPVSYADVAKVLEQIRLSCEAGVLNRKDAECATINLLLQIKALPPKVENNV